MYHQFVGVGLAAAALGIGNGFCEQAGPMKVDVEIQLIAAEGVNQRREALEDMAVEYCEAEY